MHVKSCSKKKQWYTANEANLLITEESISSQCVEKATGENY